MTRSLDALAGTEYTVDVVVEKDDRPHGIEWQIVRLYDSFGELLAARVLPMPSVGALNNTVKEMIEKIDTSSVLGIWAGE